MPVPVLAVLGAVAVVGALIAGLLLFEHKRLAARYADVTRDAVQRGWRFSTSYVRGERGRIDRWEGVGLSGGWTAESIAWHRRRDRDPRVLRWWNAAPGAPAPSGPIVVLLDTDGAAMPDVSTIQGRLGEFAQAAARTLFTRAFERHFGSALSLDGRELQRVEGLDTIADGFVVLSDRPIEAAPRLTPALFAAIRQACDVRAWTDVGVKRPWVGLCGDRIVLSGAAQRPPEIAQIVAVVEAGSALARGRV
jgi:hypothetical protein